MSGISVAPLLGLVVAIAGCSGAVATHAGTASGADPHRAPREQTATHAPPALENCSAHHNAVSRAIAKEFAGHELIGHGLGNEAVVLGWPGDSDEGARVVRFRENGDVAWRTYLRPLGSRYGAVVTSSVGVVSVVYANGFSVKTRNGSRWESPLFLATFDAATGASLLTTLIGQGYGGCAIATERGYLVVYSAYQQKRPPDVKAFHQWIGLDGSEVSDFPAPKKTLHDWFVGFERCSLIETEEGFLLAYVTSSGIDHDTTLYIERLDREGRRSAAPVRMPESAPRGPDGKVPGIPLLTRGSSGPLLVWSANRHMGPTADVVLASFELGPDGNPTGPRGWGEGGHNFVAFASRPPVVLTSRYGSSGPLCARELVER